MQGHDFRFGDKDGVVVSLGRYSLYTKGEEEGSSVVYSVSILGTSRTMIGVKEEWVSYDGRNRDRDETEDKMGIGHS